MTDSKGNVACATRSAFPSTYTGLSESSTGFPYTETFTNVVTETLYTTSGRGLISSIGVVTTTIYFPDVETTYSTKTGGPYTSTYTDLPVFTVNTNAEAYFGKGHKPTATVLSLATPYIYLPTYGAAGVTGDPTYACEQGAGPERYGYPPQEALDYAKLQYPELATCVPAGPEVLSESVCTTAAPATEGNRPSLSISAMRKKY